jgi:hypothetical protein
MHDGVVPRRSTLALDVMQKGPILVATVISLAFLFAATATSVLPVLLGGHEAPLAIRLSAEAAAVLGAIVWVGSYIGARVSLPDQRTGRFLTRTSAAYALVGAVLEFPVKTHAVLVDIDGPYPGQMAWNIVTAVSYICVAAVLFSPLIVKGFAIACARRNVGNV